MKILREDYKPKEIKIGVKYQTTWSKKWVNYKLIRIEGDMAFLETCSGKLIQTPTDTLLLTEAKAKRAAIKRLKNG